MNHCYGLSSFRKLTLHLCHEGKRPTEEKEYPAAVTSTLLTSVPGVSASGDVVISLIATPEMPEVEVALLARLLEKAVRKTAGAQASALIHVNVNASQVQWTTDHETTATTNETVWYTTAVRFSEDSETG